MTTHHLVVLIREGPSGHRAAHQPTAEGPSQLPVAAQQWGAVHGHRTVGAARGAMAALGDGGTCGAWVSAQRLDGGDGSYFHEENRDEIFAVSN